MQQHVQTYCSYVAASMPTNYTKTSPKILKNAPQKTPQSPPKWYFFGPGTHLGTRTVPGMLISPKLSAQRDPKDSYLETQWRPKGAHKHNTSLKIQHKIRTYKRPPKNEEPAPPRTSKSMILHKRGIDFH